jgi:plasmid stability protein
MASQLIVRNLEEELVEALRRRAARHGRSAEAEHRLILRAALLQPPAAPKPSLKALIAAIPKAEVNDDDEDFVRPVAPPRETDL